MHLPENEGSFSPNPNSDCSLSFSEYEKLELHKDHPLVPPTLGLQAHPNLIGSSLPPLMFAPTVPLKPGEELPRGPDTHSAEEEEKRPRRKRAKYRKRKHSPENSVEREEQRLERNRKSAKESRVRKKHYIEELEGEVSHCRSYQE